MDCKIKQSAAEYSDLFAEGLFPENFEELTEFGRALVKVNARVAQTISVIVAVGRGHFGDDLSAWIGWCQDEFSITNASYRCHLRQVGEMLLYLRNGDCKIKQFKRIFPLAFDKLLVMTQIPKELLPAFLSHYPELDRMSREEVRAAVSAALGETAPPVAVQQLLPGFDKALDAIVSIDEGKLLEVAASPRFDTQTALKMSYSGVTLCKASVGYLADHADELDDDMLAELAENVEMIRNRLASAVADRRKKLLNN